MDRYESKRNFMTVEEYLAFEERSKSKHEYVDGRLFVMQGTTRRHNLIAGNIFALFKAAVKGGRCRAYMSDVKVHVQEKNSFYYPDVLVSCDYFDSKSVYTDSPTLVVEVLSPSTASTDKREKLVAYEKVSSLKEYLIVHQRTKRVELYRKTENGRWEEVEEYRAGGILRINGLPCTPLKVSIAEIYDDVNYPGNDDLALEVHEDEAEYLCDTEFDW